VNESAWKNGLNFAKGCFLSIYVYFVIILIMVSEEETKKC
jgi:hypothetical protein